MCTEFFFRDLLSTAFGKFGNHCSRTRVCSFLRLQFRLGQIESLMGRIIIWIVFKSINSYSLLENLIQPAGRMLPTPALKSGLMLDNIINLKSNLKKKQQKKSIKLIRIEVNFWIIEYPWRFLNKIFLVQKVLEYPWI